MRIRETNAQTTVATEQCGCNRHDTREKGVKGKRRLGDPRVWGPDLPDIRLNPMYCEGTQQQSLGLRDARRRVSSVAMVCGGKSRSQVRACPHRGPNDLTSKVRQCSTCFVFMRLVVAFRRPDRATQNRYFPIFHVYLTTREGRIRAGAVYPFIVADATYVSIEILALKWVDADRSKAEQTAEPEFSFERVA